MFKHVHPILLSGAMLALVCEAASAQAPLPPTGTIDEIVYSGGIVEYKIQTVGFPAAIRLSAKGGKGGDALAGDKACRAYGGLGARADGVFLIGTGPGELAPGGTLRVIVGKEGDSQIDTNSGSIDKVLSGAGGGGTGILYSPTGDEGTFEVLVVGGGGGGSAVRQTLGSCTFGGEDGKNASLTECGTADTGNIEQGGCDGAGGELQEGSDGSDVTGTPGAGYKLGGGIWPWATGEEAKPGLESGGAGGTYSTDGGFGFGGGGGGVGGGGGYSGGAAGRQAADTRTGGGGGGSFVAPSAISVGIYHDNSVISGYARIESLPEENSEICLTAFGIEHPLPGAPTETQLVLTPIPSSLSPSCGQGAVGLQNWLKYTNPTDCDQAVSFVNVGLPGFMERYGTCGGPLQSCNPLQSTGATASFVVSSGDTAFFRFEGNFNNPVGFPHGFVINIVDATTDADGDGVVDCIDNCSVANADQTDSDGDGVGDACDQCPGGDDTADNDGDGIPNDCDLCPGDDTADLDGDGTPDFCDQYLGDNGIDSDGDGRPDVADFCFGPMEDCDDNGIGDSCDTTSTARFEDFNGGQNALFGLSNAAVLADDQVLLHPGVANQLGNLDFEPVSPKPATGFKASFFARNTPLLFTGDGFAFCAYDAAEHAPGVTFDEEGLGTGSVSLLFDTSIDIGDPNNNHIELRVDGQSLGVYTPSFVIASGQWLEVEMEVVLNAVTVRVGLLGSPKETVFMDVPLPSGTDLGVLRYGFGARTGTLNTAETAIEQVYFEAATSFSRDLDADGILDQCQFATFTESYAGFPPNPVALELGSNPEPTMESVFQPVIDHFTFQPNAQLDVLLSALGPAEFSLPPYGTVLVGTPALPNISATPGQAFEVPVPATPILFGTSVFFQGASIDTAAIGSEVLLTNELRVFFGPWKPGI